MRYVFDSAGNNVTVNVQAALISSKILPIADLYWFQYVNPNDPNNGALVKITNTFMTSAPYPVSIGKLQSQPGPLGTTTVNATYLPARIQRSEFVYEVGLSDQSCDVTWYTDDSSIFPAGAGRSNINFGFKWALMAGYMDACPMWIHKAFFTPGVGVNSPATLLGTTLMWRGFVRDIKADRGQVTISLASLMHIFQSTQVPTQTIQPGSRIPPFYQGNVFLFGGSITGATPQSTSTPTDLQFVFSGGGYPVDHSLRDAYFTSHQQPPPNGFTPQSNGPQPPVFRIRDNILSGGILHVYPYEPINPVTLVCVPNNSPQFLEIFTQTAIDVGSGAFAIGFPYVPPPEFSI